MYLQYLLSSPNFVRLLQRRPRHAALASQLAVVTMEPEALIMQDKMVEDVASVSK